MRAAVIVAGVVPLLACEPPFRAIVVPASVTVAPDSVTIRWGATHTLSATVRDSSGAPLPGFGVVWSSSDPVLAPVSTGGVVRGLQPSHVTITARAGNATGSAVVVTFLPTKAVALPVTEYRLVPGTSWPLTAALTDSLGRLIFGRPRRWASSDTTVFVVDDAGVVTAREAGTARVRVTSDDAADSAEVRVVHVRYVAIRPGLGPHTCALADDGRAFCWGANELGQLGNGETTRPSGPTGGAGGLHFADLRAGGGFHCALDNTGVARCWGNGARGRLGNGSLASAMAPGLVSGGRAYSRIAVGWSHACGLAGAVAVWCWGGGVVSPVSFVMPDSTALTLLSAGDSYTCGLDTAGRVWCWGRNGNGQLGDGSNAPRSTVVRAAGDSRFVVLSAGAGHSCALTAAGQAWCWGINIEGQLGDGHVTPWSPPVAVAAPPLRAISAALSHSCGLALDDVAWCWGANESGQLGDGTTTSSAQPVQVASGRRFAQIAAGGMHSCGLDLEGVAWCWGANTSGQLGDGTRIGRATPVRVLGQP